MTDNSSAPRGQEHPPSGDRRASAERRAGGDRRRNADRRVPIIHITPSQLRVLVVIERSGDQPRLAVARKLPWRIDAESIHSPQGIAELSAAMTKLAADERLTGAEAEVLLSSELCVTRAVTGAADDVQRETAALRERSQLYLSLGPGRKVIAASSTPLDVRHAHALLTVATEQTLQVIYQAVEAAGMVLSAIRAAQVCLARTVELACDGVDGGVLVLGVDDSHLELGVMNRGRLFLDYRPGGGLRIEQIGDLLGQHHTRLERYCQRQHGLEGTTLRRVLVTGARDQAQHATRSVEEFEHLEAKLLDLDRIDLPWELRGEALACDMAAAVGAGLAVVDNATDRGPNLVDQLIAKSRPPIAKILARKLIPIAAVLLVGVVFGLLAWNTRHSVKLMETELAQIQPQAARSGELRLELLGGHIELRQLDALAVQVARPPYSLLLRNLTQSVPPDVWLADIRVDSNLSATLAGASYSESSIYDLVGHLQHVPGVGQVALQGTGAGRTADRSATTFDIHLDLDLSASPAVAEEAL